MVVVMVEWEVGQPAPASKDIPSDEKVVPENRFRKYAYKEGISKKGSGERAQQTAFQRALELLVPVWVGRSGWRTHEHPLRGVFVFVLRTPTNNVRKCSCSSKMFAN